MAGLASDGLLEFHVRLVPGGRVTSYVAGELKPGDAVRVSGPMGCAYLRRRHEGPMLCVAGGTGLAPILSIVRGAIAAGMANDIHLYFGARSERDLYAIDKLEQLRSRHPRLHVHYVVGRLVTEAIESDLQHLAGWRAYLCGSPPMVEAATQLAQRKGIATEHIHADAFYPSAV
jgi:ferredoxin-NAD(P)+ reductase (naphthalene dioxygenase ferredoxin-specific)